MPVIYQQHNNSQIFLAVCIFQVGSPALLIGKDAQADLPMAESFRALVDTGATSSCITKEVADKVGLTPIGQVPIQGVSGEAYHNNYLFHVGFPIAINTPDGQTQTTVSILGREITGPEVVSGGTFDVLLGMDVISTGQLIVSGNKEASFSF